MTIKNSESRYGLGSIAIHWIMALTLLGLYLLGSYIVDLSYYDPEYKTLPAIHKGIGVLMFGLLFIRMFWALFNTKPAPVATAAKHEKRIAKLVHHLLYALMFIIPVTGYLISTADGRPIDVFGLFSVPAIDLGINQQEELAGDLHLWSANILAGVVALHALAALKHHFINRDQTLVRMLKVNSEN